LPGLEAKHEERSMERLSLHQLAGNGITPERLVDLAARFGCPMVTPFVNASTRSNSAYVETTAQARALRKRADDQGVRIYSLEVFVLEADTDVAAFRPALERGAILGGARTTVCVADQNLGRAKERFEVFCEMAADNAIKVHVEFHAFGTLNTLAATEAFLAGSSSGATLSVDVLHFYRNENSIDSLLAGPKIPIGHAQLCDGPLHRPREEWLFEAVTDRLIPGEGAFDLISFLRALPSDVMIDIEVPSQPRPGTAASDEERCKAAFDASRALLHRALPLLR